jgi:hypothetical protein
VRRRPTPGPGTVCWVVAAAGLLRMDERLTLGMRCVCVFCRVFARFWAMAHIVSQTHAGRCVSNHPTLSPAAAPLLWTLALPRPDPAVRTHTPLKLRLVLRTFHGEN